MKKLLSFSFLLFAFPASAFAACTSPAGQGGDIIYNSNFDVMQYCNDTTWLGFPKSAAGCSLPWGGTVTNSGSVTAYQAANVAYGNSCVQETRTCSSSVLSGTYQYQTCSVGAASDCVLNGVTVTSGTSYTFYSSQSHANCSSVGLSRTCTNGTLSGSASYQYANCYAPGQQVFTASNSFVVPSGVTSVSAVCVGAGGSGNTNATDGVGRRGGDLRYAVALSTTPGETLTVTIGVSNSTASTIARGGTVLLSAASGYKWNTAAGTSSTVGGNIGGGNGGNAATNGQGGGGGAGGYSGAGGAGGAPNGSAGSGGGGGGGGDDSGSNYPGSGGGVGLLGAGSNGSAGSNGAGGGGGSGGGNGSTGGSGSTGPGGAYGGGGVGMSGSAGVGGAGACRIIWGSGRAYPSTGTADQ